MQPDVDNGEIATAALDERKRILDTRHNRCDFVAKIATMLSSRSPMSNSSSTMRTRPLALPADIPVMLRETLPCRKTEIAIRRNWGVG